MKVPKKHDNTDDFQSPMPNQIDSSLNNNSMNQNSINNDNVDNGNFDDENFDNDFNNDSKMGDEEEDTPKKEIQRLTGKLSQELRLYNDDNDDSELSKYVAGMIIPQAVKNLTTKEKNQIIKKINNNDIEDDIDDENDDEFENADDKNDNISETFNCLDDKKSRHEKKMFIKSKKNNPFISKR